MILKFINSTCSIFSGGFWKSSFAIFGAIVGWVVAEFSAAFPLAIITVVFIAYDAWTAYRLDKRVKEAYPDKATRPAKFTSFAFGKVVKETLPQRLGLILLAYLLEHWVFIHVSIPLSYIVTGIVCFEQFWSILENESSCRADGKFWKVLQKIMIDKTERHFDVDLKDLKADDSQVESARQNAFLSPVTQRRSKVIILGTAHGSNVAGKHSPDKTFYEYRYSRMIISELKPILESYGYDVRIDIAGDVEKSLDYRVRVVNGLCEEFGASNCIYISIHNDAAGGDGKWHNAGGWSAWTTRGNTNADKLAECLCSAAENNLKEYAQMMEEGKKTGAYGKTQRAFRFDTLDGDKDQEANYYVLKNTRCPAVLTENLFQDNKEDVAYLMSDEGRQAILRLHAEGIIRYCELS